MFKILIVEDDPALHAGLCFELDTDGYLTVSAYNCEKARLLMQCETFDLAILDVNLPDGSGFDLFQMQKSIVEAADIRASVGRKAAQGNFYAAL